VLTAAELDDLLARWVEDGLLSPGQADRIRAAEAAADRPARPRAVSLVAEGLGYVGGVLVLVAAVTVAARYWSGMGVAGRLGTVAGAAALLVAAGAAAPGGPAGRRLRALTWAAAVVAAGGAAGLLGDEGLGLEGETVGVLAGVVATVVALALAALHRTALQRTAVLAAAAFTAGVVAAVLPRGDGDTAGLAVWGVGAAWIVLGWGGVLGRDRTDRVVADLAGGAAVLIGTLAGVGSDTGTVLAVVTVLVLVTAGVLVRDLVLLGVGAFATLVLVPVVVSRWFPDTLAAPAALLVVGVLLVAAALVAARRRPAAGSDRRGTPRTAVTLAVGVVVVIGIAVVLGAA
jgi:uncharacterized membrane protein YidH (DUF202 family)